MREKAQPLLCEQPNDSTNQPWVYSASNLPGLLGIARAIPIGLIQLLSWVSSRWRTWFHVVESAGSHGMTDLDLDLTLHFSEDFN
jgi:hypothetical protein